MVIFFSLLAFIAIFPIFTVNFATDQYYHFLYSIKKEEGNATINNIVTHTAQYDNSTQRLTKIADLITQNFTDYWWIYQRDERFCRDSNGTADWCSPLFGTPLYNIFERNSHYYIYVVDKIGNVTTYKTNDLSFNPYWIAYQKAGACQAISVFFNETANRSGFITRVVRSSGIDHMWNEVYIGGTWKYFDIQRYGERTNNNSSYWFGDTKNYPADLENLTKCGVYVLNLSDGGFGEDITQSYDPNFLYPHGKYNSPGCPV